MLGSQASNWRLIAIVLAYGCSVDDRTLTLPVTVSAQLGGAGELGASGHAGTSGHAGRASAGGSNAGGSIQGGAAGRNSGGQGGTAGGGPVLPLKCPDLNKNQLLDCDETLTQNSEFNEDVSRWLPDPDITATWMSSDANGFADSGAMKLKFTLVSDLTNNLVVENSRQCLPVQGGATYDFGAQVFIRAGQGTGSGGLSVHWFSTVGCSSAGFVAATEASTNIADRWTEIHRSATAPDAAKSVMLNLAVTKPYKQPDFEVSFDNVLFVKQ